MSLNFYKFILVATLMCGCAQARSQQLRNTYRLYGTLATTEADCADELVPTTGLNFYCQANTASTSGLFIIDTLAPLNTARTVYHNNMNWGLKYLNSQGIIGSTYTVQIYLKVTNFGYFWTRIIDFSDGASDKGLYFTNLGTPPPSSSRCLNFYPNGNFGACPFFNDSTYYLLTVTRNDTTKLIDIYVNDQLFTSYKDTANFYVSTVGRPVHIFRDDPVGSSCEDGEANFAYISFANYYSKEADVSSIYQNIDAIANTADFSITPSATCIGNNVTITYTGNIPNNQTSYRFNWKWNGGKVLSGSGIGPFVVRWDTAGLKAIALSISDGTCGSPTTNVKRLLIGAAVRSMVNANICSGQTYLLPNGVAVSTPGDYYDTLRTTTGCDSLVVTHLSVTPVVRIRKEAAICAGQQYVLPSQAVATMPGTYFDTLHAANGCDSILYTVILTPEVTALHHNLIASICLGETYSMPSGIGISAAGNYSDTMRYSTGCDSLITNIRLEVDMPKRVDTMASICRSEGYVLPSGSVVMYAGTYFDTLKNERGCDSIVYRITLFKDPLTGVTVSKSNDISCMISSASLKATGGVQYAWSPSTGLDNSTIADPVASPSTTTMYSVSVTTNGGCTVIDSIEVKVSKGAVNDDTYLLPSAFTPNADGKNDCFGLRTWGSLSDLRFAIFDRWGEIIFSTSDPSQCWDGTYKGTSLETGTFIYKISATTICGPVSRKGTITLIR